MSDLKNLSDIMEPNNNVKPVNVEEIIPTMEEAIQPVDYQESIIELSRKQDEELAEQARLILLQKKEEFELNQLSNNSDQVNTDDMDTFFDKEDKGLSDSDLSTSNELDDLFKDDKPAAKTGKSDQKEKSSDEIVADAKKDYKEVVKPIKNIIDLSSFTVSAESKNIFSITKPIKSNTADHVLPNTGVAITMEEFKAVDISKLDPDTYRGTKSVINIQKDIIHIMYDHIVNESKPDFGTFCKLIKAEDLKHLQFAVYKSSFAKQNIIPYECESCKSVFFAEVAMSDLMKFRTPEDEATYNGIFNNPDSYMFSAKMETDMYQISDDYVVELHQPSIYNMIFEILSIDRGLIDEYERTVESIPYIENILYINRESGVLERIDIKGQTMAESCKYKLTRFSKIISTLDLDEYNLLASYISKYGPKGGIYYVKPEVKCTKCGHSHKEEEQNDPLTLLFTRALMTGIANS